VPINCGTRETPVITTKPRWTVTASSIGHLPDVQSASFGGLAALEQQQITCSEIQVFQIGAAPTANAYFPHL
jgi:hypothetical protein